MKRLIVSLDESVRTPDWAAGAVERLQRGECVEVTPRGSSMRGVIEDGQMVVIAPCQPDELAVGDIVLVQIRGRRFQHLVLHAICGGSGDEFLIGGATGRRDGWVPARNIFGKVRKS